MRCMPHRLISLLPVFSSPQGHPCAQAPRHPFLSSKATVDILAVSFPPPPAKAAALERYVPSGIGIMFQLPEHASPLALAVNLDSSTSGSTAISPQVTMQTFFSYPTLSVIHGHASPGDGQQVLLFLSSFQSSPSPFLWSQGRPFVQLSPLYFTKPLCPTTATDTSQIMAGSMTSWAVHDKSNIGGKKNVGGSRTVWFHQLPPRSRQSSHFQVRAWVDGMHNATFLKRGKSSEQSRCPTAPAFQVYLEITDR